MVWPYTNTGVVWKITKVNANASIAATPPTTKTTATLEDYTLSPISLNASKPSISPVSLLPLLMLLLIKLVDKLIIRQRHHQLEFQVYLNIMVYFKFRLK